MRRSCVGSGCDLHADETGQAGENTAGEERKRGEYVHKSTERQHQEKNKNDGKENSDSAILLFQERIGAFADRQSDLLHLIGTFVHFEHSFCQNKSKQQRYDLSLIHI